MRTRLSAFALILIVILTFSPLRAQTAQPVYLYLLEGNGTNLGTVHAFRVNTSTGALTEVSGSPFNAGLLPQQILVDSSGRFVYVINEQSQDITALAVNSSTGALTALPGSPFPIGANPVTAAVDPTGRFLYVFATGPVGNRTFEYLYEYTIDSTAGFLTLTSSSPTTWEMGFGYTIVSMAFSPTGARAYLGQAFIGNGGAPTLICSVDFNSGTLTQIGSVKPAMTGQANHIAISPMGNLLFSVDSPFNDADAFTVNTTTGALTEIAGSPYPVPNNPYSLVVHPSGNFLYIVNRNEAYQINPPSQFDGSVSAFSINAATEALTQLAASPYSDGINPTSIVLDPTGSFAYTATTQYTTGTYTAFAQILGFSINSSSGALTPFSSASFTDAMQSNGAQLAISNGPQATPNPVPMISSLSPSSAIATAVPFVLQVNGSNFVPGSTVYFGGQPRVTTYVNSTQLTANILGNDIDNSGTAIVIVFNPLPGGGPSTPVGFPVSASAPVITSLNPPSVTADAPAFALFVIGTGFITSSVIDFNGTALATNYTSPTAISAEIFPAQILTPGTATVSVSSPSNGVAGGGVSNTVSLTIAAPNQQPVINSIYPPSAAAGGPAFTLTVTGSGFVQGATVRFNLNNVATTFVSSGQLTASIPLTAIATAGNLAVIVTDPDGLNSTPLTFTIVQSSVSPQSLPMGSNALNLNVFGTGFSTGSAVLVNDNSRATTFVSSNMLQATLKPSDVTQGGITLNITVMNVAPAGTTGPIPFLVTEDYGLSSSSSSQTAVAGQAANYSLELAALNGTLGEAVSFSASGLPPLANPTFLPQIVPAGSPNTTVLLSIGTAAHLTSSSPPLGFLRRQWPLGAFWSGSATLAILLLWFAAWIQNRRPHRVAPIFFIALLAAIALGLAACGSVAGPPAAQMNGTPAGNYTITVTAGSGSATITTTLKLTVM